MPNWTKIVAVVLVAATTIPGYLLLQQSLSLGYDQPVVGVKGEATSGWINDVQTSGGDGNDMHPSIASIGDMVYVAFSRYDSVSGFFRIAVIESTDGGVTWSQIGDFSPGLHDCKYPVMTAYAGALFVAFQYDLSPTDHDIYCYASSTGATGPWTPYTVRADASDDYRPTISSVTITNYGGVYVAFESHAGGVDGTDLLICKSTGGTFSPAVAFVGVGDSSEFTAADMCVYDDQNYPTIYVAFQKLSGGQNDIYFTRSLNGASTWSPLYQVTSNTNDEYAPSISAYILYVIVSYVMWTDNPDVYATIWNGAAFGQASVVSNSADYEGRPKSCNLFDDFYVVYARGPSYTDGGLYARSAVGSLSPSWGTPSMISDSVAAVDAENPPGLATCDRPDSNFYLAVAWGDYRTSLGNPDVYYSTQGCRFTMDTDPAGITFEVDGAIYSSQQTFNWPAGYEHALTATPDGFSYWSDGTNQWLTPAVTVSASTNDVPGMIAYYGVIPEFSFLALPIVGMIFIILLPRTRRGNKGCAR
jgi:hypothetical protein